MRSNQLQPEACPTTPEHSGRLAVKEYLSAILIDGRHVCARPWHAAPWMKGTIADSCFNLRPTIYDVFNTSIKASCGILTVPNAFMRFLPSFCFSKSLRLREMSPP